MNPEEPIHLLPNVRFEHVESSSGYIWGNPVPKSRIVRQLALEESGTPLWEASRLKHLQLCQDDIVSERWICSDDHKYPSMVNNSDSQPFSLNSILKEYGDKLLGYEHIDYFKHFLSTVMKLIDTNSTKQIGSLSVQTHPGYKSKISSPKPEMWKGQGRIYLGWNRKVSPQLIREAIAKNTFESFLNEITLSKNLLIMVPAGVVHAIRYGTFLSEWSMAPGLGGVENGHDLSQSTFTIYDRTDGRQPRPGKEDIETALGIIKEECALSPSTNYRSKVEPIFRDDCGNQKNFLFRTPEVFVEQWEIATNMHIQEIRRGFPLYIERGAVNLVYSKGETRLRSGDEVFIPAAIKSFKLEKMGTETAILQTWYAPFPDEKQILEKIKQDLAFGFGNIIFTDRDLKDFAHRGTTLGEVKRQLKAVQNGTNFVCIDRPCTVGDGIKVVSKDEIDRFLTLYTKAAAASRVMKFVPASGAATRMFHPLGTSEKLFKNTLHQRPDKNAQLEKENFSIELYSQLSKFAFYEDLSSILTQSGLDLGSLVKQRNYEPIRMALLGSKGLNYSHLPKGLVKFHRYDKSSHTAFEEHIVEALQYAQDDSGIAKVHFTLSPGVEREVQNHIDSIRNYYGKLGKVLKITLSIQKSSTDVIATDLWNNPIRQEDGHLVFRPGGHGALLNNLNGIDGDIVFIKNIDNVLPEWKNHDMVLYKKILCGYLVSLQKRLFEYLFCLERNDVGNSLLEEMFNFATNELSLVLPQDVLQASIAKKYDYLFGSFNRPIRICGVVPNVGEPGGGPFWTRTSLFPLQIVESAQVELQDFEQGEIWKASQYFNPVDIVCGLRDYKGQLFNLSNFSNNASVTVSIKTDKGLKIKALELPGLWNGSMAFWNTVFVEVPESTFGPVKSIFDLLRENHQPTQG